MTGVVLSLVLGVTAPAFAEQEQPAATVLPALLRDLSWTAGERRRRGLELSATQPARPDAACETQRRQVLLDAVAKAIDGREMPRVHGDPAMPVWGRSCAKTPPSPARPRSGATNTPTTRSAPSPST